MLLPGPMPGDPTLVVTEQQNRAWSMCWWASFLLGDTGSALCGNTIDLYKTNHLLFFSGWTWSHRQTQGSHVCTSGGEKVADLLQQEKGKLLLVLTVNQKPCSAVLYSQSQQQDQKALCGVETSLDMSWCGLAATHSKVLLLRWYFYEQVTGLLCTCSCYS